MKAYLRESEPAGAAASKSGQTIDVEHGIGYDFTYDDQDNFFLVVDDMLYEEVSTAFDFKNE